MRALLVESEQTIAEAIGRQLTQGKIFHNIVNWQCFEELIAARDDPFEHYDAIIIGDVPDAEGCVSLLRERQVAAVVFCLIEHRSATTTVGLLRAGADDVLVKPVVSAELLARIEATRRRFRGMVSNAVKVGRITVFLDGRDPEVDGERLRLSQREHAILSVLAANHRRVVSKDRIYDEVYGLSGADPLDKVIDVYICKLRKKIAGVTDGGRYIETVYGRGYKFEAPPEHEPLPQRSVAERFADLTAAKDNRRFTFASLIEKKDTHEFFKLSKEHAA